MTNTNRLSYLAFAAVLLFLLSFSALLEAENVDLVTLPARDGVQLTIYNSEDLTLVREIRSLSFKKGLNTLQFSWVNTLIDPTSIEFTPIEKRDQITLVDTVYPGAKPTHLTWNIDSSYEGSARVLVSYFISGLTWSMAYTLVSNSEETELDFDGDITVSNRSGEDFDEANVRVIVGKINLLEKIATLARKQGILPGDLNEGETRELRRKAVHEVIKDFENNISESKYYSGTTGSLTPTKKEVKKETISDYHIFTVEGTETLRNGTTRKMKAIEAENVTFDIVYRMRYYEYGDFPVRFLIWTNDKEHKLGACPLPDGKLNIYRKNEFGLSYMGGKTIKYVPVKAKVEINLGVDNLVVYDCRQVNTSYSNFEFEKDEDDGKEYVIGWTETTNWLDWVRNYRNQPITFELRQIFEGDIEYRADIKATLFDYQTVEHIFTVEPNSKKEFSSTVKANQESRAEQDSIRLR